MELEMGIRRQFVCEKRGDLRASCEGRETWEWRDEYPLRRLMKLMPFRMMMRNMMYCNEKIDRLIKEYLLTTTVVMMYSPC